MTVAKIENGELTIETTLRFDTTQNINLRGTPITELPAGLNVGGSLDLSHTPITDLPGGLTVGGDICIQNTQITELPEGLIVGGSIWSDF